MPAPGNQVWRILVVDDEPAVCDAIKMMLKFDGHAVQTADGSKEALSLLEQGKFDLIITDYSMPGMKGDELAAVINAAPAPSANHNDFGLCRNVEVFR